MNQLRNTHHSLLATSRRGGPTLNPFGCASCASTLDVRSYGGVAFCAECRAQSDLFAGKELYTDIGGGD